MFSIIFFATAARSQTRPVQLRLQTGSHGLGAGMLRCWTGCPGLQRGWGAQGLHPWTAQLPRASGWASASSPGRASPAGGQRLPSPGLTGSLPRCPETLPGSTTSLPRGSDHPFSGPNRGSSCPSPPNPRHPPGTSPPPPLTRVICLQGARRQLSLRGCSLVIKQFSLLIFQA